MIRAAKVATDSRRQATGPEISETNLAPLTPRILNIWTHAKTQTTVICTTKDKKKVFPIIGIILTVKTETGKFGVV